MGGEESGPMAGQERGAIEGQSTCSRERDRAYRCDSDVIARRATRVIVTDSDIRQTGGQQSHHVYPVSAPSSSSYVTSHHVHASSPLLLYIGHGIINYTMLTLSLFSYIT